MSKTRVPDAPFVEIYAGNLLPYDATERATDGKSQRMSGEAPGPDWGRLGVDALETMTGRLRWRIATAKTERSRGGIGISDAVQEAIVEVLSSEPLPATHEEAVQEVVKHSRRWMKSWAKRLRENSQKLDQYASEISTLDLFELICARDEVLRFLDQLYRELEEQPEAKMVLWAILEKGFQFHETKLIANEINLDEQHVTNLKKRIVRRARTVMIDLTSAHTKGGAA